MVTNVPPALGQPAPTPAKKNRWPLYALASLLGVALVIAGTVAITLWWIQRPIKPVVLTPQEKTVVDAKLRYVEEPESRALGDLRRANPARVTGEPGANASPTENQPYVPGGKEVKLTQRELNGLLNANTDLGKTVRLQFEQDAIDAYLAVPIPPDFPILGGKMFRARGQFHLAIGNGGTPYAVLDDITVFGLSLPNAWLGGIKGQNLFADALGQGNRGPVLSGIKRLRIEPGALVLQVED